MDIAVLENKVRSLTEQQQLTEHIFGRKMLKHL